MVLFLCFHSIHVHISDVGRPHIRASNHTIPALRDYLNRPVGICTCPISLGKKQRHISVQVTTLYLSDILCMYGIYHLCSIQPRANTTAVSCFHRSNHVLNLAWIFRVQQASRAPVPEQRKVALCIRRLNSYNSSNTGACHYLQFVPSGQLTEHCRMSRFPDRSILSPQSWAADNRPPHSSYGRTPKRR